MLGDWEESTRDGKEKRAERRECKGWVKKRGKKTSAINGERRKGEEMRILVQT